MYPNARSSRLTVKEFLGEKFYCCWLLIVGERKMKSSSRLLPPVQTQTRKIITVKAIHSPQGLATLVPVKQEITLVPFDQSTVKCEGAAVGTRDIIGQTKLQKLVFASQQQEAVRVEEPVASMSYKVSDPDNNRLTLTYPASSNSQFKTQNSFCEGKEMSTSCGAQFLEIKGDNFHLNDNHSILGAEVSRSIHTSQEVTKEQKPVTLTTNTLTTDGLKLESEHVTGHVMENSAPSRGEI